MIGGRILIVNADDFGLSAGVNRGIIRAHEHGVVTSATLMVRGPRASEAAEYAKAHATMSLGLHLDLGEWQYLAGNWVTRYEVVASEDPDAVSAEIARQLNRFHRLVGRPPTHLDSHQHVHRSEPVRRLLVAAGERLGVPVRDVTTGVTYCGDFHGQDGRGFPVPEAITVDALVGIVQKLPFGVTELACHPGEGTDLQTTYLQERSIEVATLCDARVRAAIDESGVLLRSFGVVRSPTGRRPPSATIGTGSDGSPATGDRAGPRSA